MIILLSIKCFDVGVGFGGSTFKNNKGAVVYRRF